MAEMAVDEPKEAPQIGNSEQETITDPAESAESEPVADPAEFAESEPVAEPEGALDEGPVADIAEALNIEPEETEDPSTDVENADQNDEPIDDALTATPADALVAPTINLSRFDGQTGILAGTTQANIGLIVSDQNGTIFEGGSDGSGNFALSFDYLIPSEGAILELAAVDGDGLRLGASTLTVLPIENENPVIVELTDDGATLADAPDASQQAVALSQVEYGQDGPITLGGVAPALSTVQVFIDGQNVGSASADATGNWQLTLDRLADGDHNLEFVDANGVTVETQINIAATPSTSVETVTIDVPDELLDELETVTTTNTDGITAVVGAAEYSVIRGDSLWRIARNRFGEGIRYVDIYERNRDKIDDPDLIFPGQVIEFE